MKVSHIITSIGFGGAEMALQRLLLNTNRNRNQHQVISLTTLGPIGDNLQKHGFSVQALHMKPGIPDLRALILLRRILCKQNPDIAQTWLYHADLLGLLAARLAGIKKVVWNIRSSYMDLSQYRLTSRLTVGVCARLSHLPAAVIVNSKAGLAHHQALGYRPKRWELIPNGVDTEVFKPDAQARRSVRQDLGLEPDTLLIGFVARFDPMKDHAAFIAAAHKLHAVLPQVHFLLCGTDVTPENPTLARAIGVGSLAARVHLLGSRQDIPRITAALDLATLASLGEGFPNIVAEAMACGVPCVVTDVGDAAMLVADTGCVIPIRDAQALTESWESLLSLSKDQRIQLGASARVRIESDFSMARNIQRYEDLYQQILNA